MSRFHGAPCPSLALLHEHSLARVRHLHWIACYFEHCFKRMQRTHA